MEAFIEIELKYRKPNKPGSYFIKMRTKMGPDQYAEMIGAANFDGLNFVGGLVLLYPQLKVEYWLEPVSMPYDHPRYYLIKISAMDISQQTHDAFKKGGYFYVHQLIEAGQSELMKCKNIGNKRIAEIKRALKRFGIKLPVTKAMTSAEFWDKLVSESKTKL